MTAYMAATRPDSPVTASSPLEAARFLYGAAAELRLSALGALLVYVAGVYVDDLAAV